MQLMDYLPLYFKNIREYEAIMTAEQPEITGLLMAIDTMQNNEFIETLNEAGCEHWEKMLGITPSAAATLEDRRFIIGSKYKESLPYTLNALRARLDSTLGTGNYALEEIREEYKLKLRIMLVRKYQINEVQELLENLVPCNIILDVGLLYNQHRTVGQYAHNYLKGFTYSGVREEVLG